AFRSGAIFMKFGRAPATVTIFIGSPMADDFRARPCFGDTTAAERREPGDVACSGRGNPQGIDSTPDEPAWRENQATVPLFPVQTSNQKVASRRLASRSHKE